MSLEKIALFMDRLTCSYSQQSLSRRREHLPTSKLTACLTGFSIVGHSVFAGFALAWLTVLVEQRTMIIQLKFGKCLSREKGFISKEAVRQSWIRV
jgi:hypothetical protein